jgi:gamma-glutamylcyclotransferase (GGCT)/AIG2-like uncharacterized protein YtfP
MNKFYFAYGMNTNVNEMTLRCPNAVNLGKCTLKNFDLKFRHHADIDLVPGSEMEGVLWYITSKCEKALDGLEGYPYYYNKINVVVNDNIIAMAYIMNEKGLEEPPSIQYENCLIDGYSFNGLDVDKLTSKIDFITHNK